jgi:hypothetical protein
MHRYVVSVYNCAILYHTLLVIVCFWLLHVLPYTVMFIVWLYMTVPPCIIQRYVHCVNTYDCSTLHHPRCIYFVTVPSASYPFTFNVWLWMLQLVTYIALCLIYDCDCSILYHPTFVCDCFILYFSPLNVALYGTIETSLVPINIVNSLSWHLYFSLYSKSAHFFLILLGACETNRSFCHKNNYLFNW